MVKFARRNSWWIGIAAAFGVLPCFAADSSAGSDPQMVLRDVLSAACAQKDAEFGRALTARNREAYAHLTPAARSKFLKRFVLLDEAGQPRVEDGPGGALQVSCVTPRVTTVMEIGKPEVQDNLAYISLVVREATDSSGISAKRVVMGLVREQGQWKLLSLGLLLLDLPTLGEEWDRAEMKSNEESAAAHMKELAKAIEEYRKTYTRLPDELAWLGPPESGPVTPEKAGVVSKDLAAGHQDGYTFRYVVVGASTTGAPAKYELAGIPSDYGRTGGRSFFMDSSGVLHAADHKGAVGSIADPKVD
jgi:hypothetical protein